MKPETDRDDGPRLDAGAEAQPTRPVVVTRSWKRWVLLGLGVLLTLFIVASSILFVWPPTDQPRHADAILSLNGRNEGAREATAISLAERGYAPVLLFSQGNSYTTPCPKVPQVEVKCFEPVPGRTVGEVEWAARYAREQGWHSLIVVPGRAQSVRARVLLERCFSGSVTVVPAPVKTSQLPYEVVYEWGALGRALLFDRHC